MQYRGISRKIEHHPYYVWEEPLSKWEDDEFDGDRSHISEEYWDRNMKPEGNLESTA
jgi:hypothetical protein